jgi:hypothetical protein
MNVLILISLTNSFKNNSNTSAKDLPNSPKSYITQPLSTFLQTKYSKNLKENLISS